MVGKNSQRGQGTGRHRPREKPSEGHQPGTQSSIGDKDRRPSRTLVQGKKFEDPGKHKSQRPPPLWNQLSLPNQANRVRKRLRTQVRTNERGNIKDRTEEPPKNGFV